MEATLAAKEVGTDDHRVLCRQGILYLQLASPGFLDILYGNPFGIYCNDSLPCSIWGCLLDGEKNCGNRGVVDVAPYCHFVILLLLTVCSTLGWIHVENIGAAKGRKMFLVVALAGNITGGLLTWTKGGGQVFEEGYELKRRKVLMKKKLWYPWKEKKQAVSMYRSRKKNWKKEDTGQPEVLTERGRRRTEASGICSKL